MEDQIQGEVRVGIAGGVGGSTPSKFFDPLLIIACYRLSTLAAYGQPPSYFLAIPIQKTENGEPENGGPNLAENGGPENAGPS